jgi:membrane protease YdiL (CAAX protease family)
MTIVMTARRNGVPQIVTGAGCGRRRRPPSIEAMSNTRFLDYERRLRTGWRVLIGYVGFLAVELLVAFAVALPMDALHVPRWLLQAVASLALAVAMLGLVAGLRRFVDRRPWSGLGLRFGRRSLPQLLAGVAAGTGAMTAAAALGVALGWARWAPPQIGLATLGPVAFGVGFIAVSEAFPEELLFRGYLFRNLADALPLRVAWPLTAVLFGALHILSNSGAHSLQQQLLYVGMAIGFGLLATAARIVTGALWMCFGVHTGVDALLGLAAPLTPDRYGGVLVADAVALAVASVLVLAWSAARNARSVRDAPEPSAA